MRNMKSMLYLMLIMFASLILMGSGRAADYKDKPPAVLATTFVNATNPSSINVGQTLTVNVSVIEVTDLYLWQIELSYNNNTLEFLSGAYPSDHVFAGKPFVPVVPLVDYDYLRKTWFVLHGCTLQGTQPGVNGSGTLCQIMFRARALDGSYLNFTDIDVDTYLLDSNLDSIPFVPIDSEVTVVSEFSSVLVPSLFLIITFVTIFYARKFVSKKKM